MSLPPLRYSFTPLLPRLRTDAVPPPSALTTGSQAEIHSRFSTSKHIFPAAFPRSKQGSALKTAYKRTPRAKTTKEAETLVHDMLMRLNDAPLANLDKIEEPQLWISVKRYLPHKLRRGEQRGRGLTLILNPANGFHKEAAEPFLEHLLDLASPNYHIEDIWALDLVNQGEGCVINREHIGQVFDWIDVGRDAAQFVLDYLPHAGEQSVPFQLPIVPFSKEEEIQVKRAKSVDTGVSFPRWRDRHVVLVGHSIGGNGMVTAAHILNRLICGLVCIDPVVHGSRADSKSLGLFQGAFRRQDTWPTRAAALESFKRSKGFFGLWDPRVLELYVKDALYEDEQGAVRLKCEREQEALGFSGPPFAAAENAFNRLSQLDPHLNVRFTLANLEKAAGFSPDLNLLLEASKQTNTSGTRLSCGHLIIQEDPKGLAEDLHDTFSKWTRGIRSKL